MQAKELTLCGGLNVHLLIDRDCLSTCQLTQVNEHLEARLITTHAHSFVTQPPEHLWGQRSKT